MKAPHIKMDNSVLSRLLSSQANSPRLTLTDCFIGDQGLKLVIPFLADHPNISTLELKGNNISPAGFGELCNFLKFHHKLTSLICEWNNIGLEELGMQSLLSLVQYNKNLVHVDLRNNKLGINEAMIIGNMLKTNTSLLSLDLRWNEIRNKGITYILDGLKENFTLIYLEVQGNNISGENQKAVDYYLQRNREDNKISKEDIISNNKEKIQNSLIQQKNVLIEKELNQYLGSGDKSRINDQNSFLDKLHDTLGQERKVNLEIAEKLDQEIERLRNQELDDERFLKDYELKIERAILENDSLKRANGLIKRDIEDLNFGTLKSLKMEENRIKSHEAELELMQKEHQIALEKKVDDHNRRLNALKADWDDQIKLLETRIRDLQAMIIELQSQEKDLIQTTRDKNRIYDEQFESTKVRKIEEEDFLKFYKLKDLEQKINVTRVKLMGIIRRNGNLMNELKSLDENHSNELNFLEQELIHLKQEYEVFSETNQEFVLLMDKLRLDLNMKEGKIEKMQKEIEVNRERLEQKRHYGQKEKHQDESKKEEEKRHWQAEKEKLLRKINELEQVFLEESNENMKLKNDGNRLIQLLQSTVSKTVYEVFSVNKFI